ncbi:20907_t:CDS:10 [Gigaspora margarita]|uniref:Ubiquitin carboxyl-terminal hydrolase n=1 Tax=Gigaspora margarita TaxID=4874 RepID=A0ABN7VEH4_GIGMA|nr:20907_t:CDS:10 [Gigaspora margarita]
MESCPHVFGHCKLPSAFTQVYKEECTQCFDSQDLAPGIDVCLTCFNAGCNNSERHHAQNHYEKTNHPLVLNIHRLIKDKPKRADENEEPPQKISKLAIIPESDKDKYEFITHVKCYACGGIEVDRTSGDLPAVIDAVMTSMSAAKQSEIKAWEEGNIVICDHTRDLVQEQSRTLESQSLAHCNNCDLKENLWLCLVCGNLGCGRQQYGGLGGNGHGLAHYNLTKHSISCKLGTITPEGTADIYCYECDESRLDPYLDKHLANFGINVASQQKTEKSMTELQIEQNQLFGWSMETKDGKKLEPLFGPGYTGIKNLGNSCYMASVLQSVFSLDAFQQRYYPTAMEHHKQCTQDNPANCIQCQLSKLADGLLSGRYSQPTQIIDAENEQPEQDGVAPGMFKTLIGKGHDEFSTMRQQDAFEFFQYLVTTIERKEHSNPTNDPTNIFKFTIQRRLQCVECNRVRYKDSTESSISISVPANKIETNENNETKYEPVTFEKCLQLFAADSAVEYTCPACNKKTIAMTNTRFLTFPEVLVVHTRRFEEENWVPRKIVVPILFEQDCYTFDEYIAHGRQDNEELLPEESTAGPAINESDLNKLLEMGFPENRCRKALIATGNNGADQAMNWLFEHMDDADIDAPILGSASVSNAQEPSEGDVSTLMAMGFSETRVRKALSETCNNVERAVEWLFSHPEDESDSLSVQVDANNTIKAFGDSTLPAEYQLQSFISHKGTSVHCGHYVVHVRKGEKWVLFNDNNVVEDPQPPLEEAYVYILMRVRR